jgi:hypothetical protein
MGRAAVLALTLALAASGARATEAPRVRPLESPADEAPPAAGDAAPALPLPETVAVCRDAGGRCWTAPDAETCGGVDRVFRVVLGDGRGRHAETALAQCRGTPASSH